jgi:cation:H+ antiporter
MVTSLMVFLGGLAVLIAGAEGLVRGSSRLGAAFGLSPLVIGLTVVSYGTSAPELTVSVYAAVEGRADIAVANVVGSNIFNVLLVLGLCAVVTPLAVSRRLVWVDVPIMIGASLLLLPLGRDGALVRWEGAFLVLLAAGYTVFLIRQSRREAGAAGAAGPAPAGAAAGGPAPDRAAPERAARSPAPLARHAGLAIGGLALLVIGARFVVEGASGAARALGVSDLVIGLTLVACGTSLPEVATSVVAALRGERDIAVGNVVGSNICNVLAVLGLSAAAGTGGVAVSAAVRAFDLPVMIAVSVACLPIFFTGHRLARWEGCLFLGYYAAYVAYVVLGAARHEALPAYHDAMLGFVAPLTAITILVLAARQAVVRGWRVARDRGRRGR